MKLTALALAVASCTLYSSEGSEAVRPSVVVILVDDLGTADLSYSSKRLNNGYAAFETPNLDALAESEGGIQLAKAYTHMICGPSRAALVTGRLAHNLGNPFAMVQGGGLDPKFKTIGHEFKARQYSTHFVGKWGIDYPYPTEQVLAEGPSYNYFNGRAKGLGPLERGFDTFYGLHSSGHNHFTKEVRGKGMVDWHRHNATHRLDYPEVDHEPTEYSTHLFTREAVSVIDRWSVDKPGFLHLSYTAPHDPLQAPQEYLDEPDCAAMKNWRRRTFCGMVKAIDRGVGEIVEALKRNKLDQHTIILFSTDNGGAPSVGGYNYPFKGQKATIYEGGIHNPAFFHVPSALEARGGVYENVIHIADFAPTLLGMVDRYNGTEPSFELLGHDIDGVDHTEYLLKKLGGSTLEAPLVNGPRNSTVLEFNAFMIHSAYLEGDWKLVLGNPGREDIFYEPNGTYFDQSLRTRYVVEELACDVIDRGMGASYSIYGWVLRFLIDRIFSKARGDLSQEKMFNMLQDVPYGHTIKITPDHLPKVEWDKYDLGKVQLYNLREDPLETRNVALEHKDLVERFAAKLRDEVRNDPGHNVSVQKLFALFMIDIVRMTVGVLLATLFVLASTVWFVCLRKENLTAKKI